MELREVVGDAKPGITPDVRKLIDAGLISEADAVKALGNNPKLLTEG